MTKEFKVAGMSCNHCRKHVENALNSIDGVKATVSLDSATASVEYSNANLTIKDFQAAVSKEGNYILSER